MKCLVLVEHEGGQLKDATLAAVTADSVASFTEVPSCSTQTSVFMRRLPYP